MFLSDLLLVRAKQVKQIMQLKYTVHASVTFTINMQSVNNFVQVLIAQITQDAGKVLYGLFIK